MQLPSKPMLRGEEPIRDQDGRIRYAKVLEFEDRETADAFSHAAWEALEHYRPP
jgi:hypothetical protein